MIMTKYDEFFNQPVPDHLRRKVDLEVAFLETIAKVVAAKVSGAHDNETDIREDYILPLYADDNEFALNIQQ